MKTYKLFLAGFFISALAGQQALAKCSDIPFSRAELIAAATFVKTDVGEQVLTGGFGNHMWVTVVDGTGKVCHIINTAGKGQNDSQVWGLSRIISAQKANTSAGLSLGTGPADVQAWASGALMLAAQPTIDPGTGFISTFVGSGQGTLFGVQFSNPIRTNKAYSGSPSTYGTNLDPIRKKRIGGVNVFGGGLPLYSTGLVKFGAIGVSGDLSCTDHAFAWRIRERLATQIGIADGAAIAAANGGTPEVLDIDGNEYPGCDGPEGTGTAGGSPNGILFTP